MKSEEIQKKLEEQNAKLPPLIAEMDQMFLQFKVDMPENVKDFINRQFTSKVSANPKITFDLGALKLGEMKTELATILDSIPAQVEEMFSHEDLWPHRKPYSEKEPAYGYKISILNDFFKTLVTPAGGLLHKYGLLIEKHGYYPLWFSDRSGKIGFSENVSFGFPIREQEFAYQKKFQTYSEIKVAINKLNIDLESAKAVELWDQA